MREYGPHQGNGEEIADTSRMLAEVDNLNRLRRPDGGHEEATLEAIHVDLLTAVKEAAMPYAVSTVHQEYRDGTFWWLDQNPVDVARSGYDFHQSDAALKRVDIEVAEAHDVNDSLQPGLVKVFISPKMTRQDAPYEVAKQEHLADDDMLRIHMLDVDPDTNEVRGKFMQSVLVRDIPLDAWIRMLKDPGNIFGRSFVIEDENSALSVMKLHQELQVPEAALPEGTVSLIEAVLPYLDKETYAKVAPRLESFRGDQDELHKKAESIADRWLAFEVELADSLEQGIATPEVSSFIFQLQHQWSGPMLDMLASHRLPQGHIQMTRPLAAKLEQAKQNSLWVAAAVATGNEETLGQLDAMTARQIRDNEHRIQAHLDSGQSVQEIMHLQASMNRLIAQQNVTVGGGCAGRSVGGFGRASKSAASKVDGELADFDPFRTPGEIDDSEEDEENSGPWYWSTGTCRIDECPTRPSTTKVGPCDVCRGCQRMFDMGKDPFKVYAMPPRPAQKRAGIYLMDVIFPSKPAPSQPKQTVPA